MMIVMAAALMGVAVWVVVPPPMRRQEGRRPPAWSVVPAGIVAVGLVCGISGVVWAVMALQSEGRCSSSCGGSDDEPSPSEADRKWPARRGPWQDECRSGRSRPWPWTTLLTMSRCWPGPRGLKRWEEAFPTPSSRPPVNREWRVWCPWPMPGSWPRRRVPHSLQLPSQWRKEPLGGLAWKPPWTPNSPRPGRLDGSWACCPSSGCSWGISSGHARRSS